MAELFHNVEQNIDNVDEFTFEPIKGQPMLRWRGKRPFTSTQFYPAQLRETYGEETEGWLNKIFWGDNLQVMSHLLKKYRGQVDLIYIDPPFDSKADYKKTIEVRGKKATNDKTAFEEKQYTDIWSNDEYLQFMYERIILLKELLSDDGVLYLHCDWHKSHLLRCILDEVFGNDNFRNEITWRRQIPRGMKVYAEYYAFSSDYILIYSKSNCPKWKRQTKQIKITREEAEKKYQKDERGFFRTSDPGSYTFDSLVALHKQGRLYAPKNGEIIIDEENRKVYASKGGKVAVKYYREIDTDGMVIEEITVDNIWNDIPGMGIVSSEYIGYPTQKPEALLERIIEASSDPGDLVFDCFMGSGTTQAVAMKLGRRFIGADINLGSIDLTVKRLTKTAELINSKLPSDEITRYTGFEIYNVNNYDVFRNPAQAKDLLIQALELQPLPGNTLYDGEKDNRMFKIMPVNRIATRADLNDLINGFPREKFEKQKESNPNKPVESVTLVCMGHEPELGASLKLALKEEGFTLDVEVIDILRDKVNLEFRREAEAEIVIEGDRLVIRDFYPMNLLQKLSMQKTEVNDWRMLVDSIKIDFNFDGSVFTPSVIDIPEGKDLVSGIYKIPADAGTIKVKITDLLSESLESTLNS